MIAFHDTDSAEDGKLPRMYAERRYQQIRRVFLTLEIVGAFRFGADLETVTEDVNDASGESWCSRTILRDLLFLQDVGLVEYIRGHKCWRSAGRVKFVRGAVASLDEPEIWTPEPCRAGRNGIRMKPAA